MIRMHPRPLRAIALAVLAGLLCAPAALAREPDPEFMKHVFPPDLVMRHASEIGLSKAQRKTISQAVKQTQSKTIDIGWDMQEAAQELTALLGRPRVDREATLAAARRVMELEVQVKHAHMGLLIAIKNALEPEQQRRLGELRD